MEGEIFASYGSEQPRQEFGFIHPYELGGGDANVFPIILGGAFSLVGYVLGNSATAISLFKVMAVTGEETFDLKEVLKDEGTAARVRDLLTTDDFAENGSYDFRNNGYLDLYNTIVEMRNAYNRTLAYYNSGKTDGSPDAKGTIAICVSGVYAVRPTWAKRTADAVEAGGYYDDAVEYSLTRLDFGTEAQLATWDGSKYMCDMDENGELRETPVVKRVYVSRCPNEPDEEGT